MKALVVYTHPHHESLNHAFLQHTLEGLEKNSRITEVEVLDLYGDNFDPVLRFGGEKRRRDMYRDPAFEKYRQQIMRADLLVFIYPIWWGRPPAMLLGYFDQVLAKDFAFRYRDNSPLPEGLLRGKRAVCISTMKGPSGYLRFMMNNVHRVLMARVVLKFVGIKRVLFFEFGSMEGKKGRQADKLAKITAFMERIKPSAQR